MSRPATVFFHGLALVGLLLAGCGTEGTREAGAPATTDLRLTANSPAPLRFVVYGDMRFTPVSETRASWPLVRQALIRQVASEHPATILLTGDVPYHGGSAADYDVYREETATWREQRIPVYAALGNHEFAQCALQDCLENWWNAFPALRGKRWYSLAMGPRITAIALDSDASLDPGSEQRDWLQATLARQPSGVDFILVYLHHPPVADPQGGALASHNARSNETQLAEMLSRVAPASHAQFLVIAGHVHNYERRVQDGITYLISGGGGAAPYDVTRDEGDLYRDPGYPNFHYLRFTLTRDRLHAEMLRLEDPESATPGRFQERDRFDVLRKPR